MNDSDVDRLIDKTHMRTTKRISQHIRHDHPEVTDKQIDKVNKARPKDSYRHQVSRYYYPIFANHQHAFQMDLLEQSHIRGAEHSSSHSSDSSFPKYFLILINVNTRYAYAFPTERKNQNAINALLTEFINNHSINSIVCDDEAAFTSKLVVDTLTEHNVSLRIITEQRHSALGIIDRFIRTLRDMNIPTVKSEHQSNDPKYRDFSVKRMNKLLDIYNNTIHSSTNHTPAEMEQDPKLEKEYITEKLYEVERKRKQKDFELGNAYVLIAQDGTIKTVSRWRIIPLGDTLPSKFKYGSSFGNNNGTVQEILNYNAHTHKYTVLFSMPDGTTYEDIIPETFLRGATPQIMAPIERAYHENHT